MADEYSDNGSFTDASVDNFTTQDLPSDYEVPSPTDTLSSSIWDSLRKYSRRLSSISWTSRQSFDSNLSAEPATSRHHLNPKPRRSWRARRDSIILKTFSDVKINGLERRSSLKSGGSSSDLSNEDNYKSRRKVLGSRAKPPGPLRLPPCRVSLAVVALILTYVISIVLSSDPAELQWEEISTTIFGSSKSALNSSLANASTIRNDWEIVRTLLSRAVRRSEDPEHLQRAVGELDKEVQLEKMRKPFFDPPTRVRSIKVKDIVWSLEETSNVLPNATSWMSSVLFGLSHPVGDIKEIELSFVSLQDLRQKNCLRVGRRGYTGLITKLDFLLMMPYTSIVRAHLQAISLDESILKSVISENGTLARDLDKWFAWDPLPPRYGGRNKLLLPKSPLTETLLSFGKPFLGSVTAFYCGIVGT